MDKSLKRGRCIKFESLKICMAGNQCDNSDLDIHNAEDKKLPVFIMCSGEGRDNCHQLKPKGSHASFVTTVIAVTIRLILSIVFSRVTVNVLVFVLRVVFFVTRYLYDARRREFALSASFLSELECFDGSEVTGKVNDSIVEEQCRRGNNRS